MLSIKGLGFLTLLLLAGCGGGGGGGGGSILGGGGVTPTTPPTISYPEASGFFEEEMTLTPTITPSGVAVTCSAPSLPAGLAINTESCVISGTPTVASSGEFSVTVSNNSGSSSTSVSFSISPKAPTLSYAGVSSSVIQGNLMNIIPALDTNGEELSDCSISPALPAGLSINAETCVISGTPTVVHNQLHTVTATNSAGNATSQVTIVVLTSATPPTLSYNGVSAAGTVGVPLSIAPSTFQENGAPTTCSISPALSAGLVFNSSTCVISGTPSAVLSGPYNITAVNSQGSASASIQISIVASAPTLSYSPSSVVGTVNSALPAITANLNNGGEPISSCVVSPALPSGVNLNNTTCAISGTPSVYQLSRVHTITVTNLANKSSTALITLTVNALNPTLSHNPSSVVGTVNSALPAIATTLYNGGAPITSCMASPALPSGVSLNNSTCAITGTPSVFQTARVHKIIVTNEAGKTAESNFNLTVNALSPTLSYSPSTVVGVVGQALPAITTNLNNGGAPISSCVMANKPSWLTIDNLTCAITGTPAAYQAATPYTITVTNADNKSSTASFNLAVHAPPTLSYSLSGGTNGTVNTPMSVTPTTLQQNGGAITDCYASLLTPLPSYLTLNTSTCVISGTPTSLLSGTTYHIYAKNQYGVSALAEVTLSVVAGKPSLSFESATGTTGSVNSPMTVTPVLNVNGDPLISCDRKPGSTALPTGLNVDPATCVISGTPTVVVNPAQPYTITATNSVGSTDAPVTLSVLVAPPTLSYAQTTGLVGANLEIIPTLNNGGAPTTCEIKPGTTPLPSGLGINQLSCWISGTPSGTSSNTYKIVATNSAGSAEADLILTVSPNVPVISFSGSTGVNGVVGHPMSIAPSSLDGRGAPVTSCSSSPALPDGLNVTPPGCVISGSPTEIPASSTFTISATNSVGSGTATVTLRIFSQPTLNLSAPENKVRQVGSCFGPMALSLHSDGKFIYLNSPLPVDLSSDGSGNFYSNANCTTEITSIDIGVLGISTNFYFKNTIAQTVALTADPNGAFGMTRAILEGVETISATPNTWVANTSVNGGPQGRSAHSAVWTGTEMIIWGGYNGTSLNTGARYNPASNTWVGATSTGSGVPSPRENHSAVWTGTEMIIWGGNGGSNSGARYNPATNTWTGATSTTGTHVPSSRYGHSAVWTGTEMIVWGGWSTSGRTNTGARYNPATNTWVGSTSTGSAVPTSRYSHSAVWTGTEMIIWGGEDISVNHTNTGARYNPATDTWVGSTSTGSGVPSARDSHSAVWTGTEMIIWGGNNGSYLNTGGRYNPVTNTWGQATSIGTLPSPRYYHSAVWTGTDMIIWGGFDGSSHNATGSRYNPTTDSWGAPTGTTSVARRGHSAVWTGSSMVIWGGETTTGPLNTGGRLNPVTNTWSSTSTTNAPTARSYHSAIWDGTRMIVWGGSDGTNYLNSGAIYNPSSNTWGVATSMANAPSARSGHTGVWTGTRMLIWGGSDGTNYLNSGKTYNPSNDQWSVSDIDSTNAPSARGYHSAVSTGSEMIIWGGVGSSGNLNNGGRFDFVDNSWSPDPMPAGPGARFGHSAVWADDKMIIWGGRSTQALDTGAIYLP